MKAREIITRAFAEVIQSKYTIEDVNLQDSLRYLNRMMAKLEIEGIEVGYTSLSDVDSELTTSNTVILGMVKNLALILWPQYSTVPVNPLIKFSANRSLDSMRSQAIATIEPAQFPSTLPIGSGRHSTIDSNSFYTNTEGQSTYLGVDND